jgi:hypothetical protein
MSKLIHHPRLALAAGALASWLAGCASDVGTEEAPIVGSHQIIERQTPVAILKSLRIRVPFRVTLQNGQPKQIMLRGEDNLIAQISIDEEGINSWRIVAPLDLDFMQHDDIAIEVPYIDMVEVKYRDNVRFIDKPGSFISELAAPEEP